MTEIAWAKADKKTCQLSSPLTLPSKHKAKDGPPATCLLPQEITTAHHAQLQTHLGPR